MTDVLKIFGRYFLLDQIAQGRMNDIFRARLANPDGAGHLYAIKRLSSGYRASSELLEKFKSHAEAALLFNHPNIVQYYDFGEIDGQPYIAMEYVDGKNLKTFLTKFFELSQSFPIELAVFIAEEVASGLHYIHTFKDRMTGVPTNVVHRNICPTEIVISYEGNMKLINMHAAPIKVGEITGRPSYLSPEQIRGEILDARSDIFSLGIVLWETLTGKKLFTAKDDLAILKLIENCDSHILPPSTLNPKIYKELDYIVLKALAQQKEKRYQSAEEFQIALHKFLYSYVPEFNPSDLSYYMMDIFKNEITENRKKISHLNEKAEQLLRLDTSALDPWDTMKLRIHRALMEQMDLMKINTDTKDAKQLAILREKTQKCILDIMATEDTYNLLQSRTLKAQMMKEVIDAALRQPISESDDSSANHNIETESTNSSTPIQIGLEPLEVWEIVPINEIETPTSKNSYKLHSSLRKIVAVLYTAFEALKKPIDPIEIERIAATIHQVYSAKYRRYHNLNHIFSMLESGETKPLAALSILFHDIIYLNVDKRIHPLLTEYLSEFTFDESWACEIPSIRDSKVDIVNNIFGFNPGQRLTSTLGLNEYLSTIIAVRMIKTFTSWEIISISACIEATIPFREKVDGKNPAEKLLRRIKDQKIALNVINRATDPEDLVKISIDVSHRDLQGFYSQDTAKFVASTWELVLENNPIFRNPLYTVKQYRSAIQKVERFHSSLTPEKIFSSYDRNNTSISIADQKQISDRLTWTWLNLDIETLYLRIQLVTHTILEALAELSGGDAPLTLLVGESPTEHNRDTRAPIELYLDFSIPEDNDGVRCVVHDLLRFGQTDTGGVVFMRSPLTSFIYERLREKQFEDILSASKQMSEGRISPKDLLVLVPKPLLGSIINAVGMISWTRKSRLDALKIELENNSKKAA